MQILSRDTMSGWVWLVYWSYGILPLASLF